MLALRRGPDAIPHSWIILFMAVGLLLFSSFCAVVLIDGVRDQDHLLTFSGYFLGLLFYAAVLVATGFTSRVLQTISAIVACGALITLLYVAAYLILQALLSEAIANLVGILIMFWTVPVEGHLIAKSIEQHAFVGITIAIMALILQLGFQSVFAGSG